MKIEIVKFDNNGRGIGYLNNKIVFVPKTVPGDIVNISLTLNKKNYAEGKLVEIITPSKLRTSPICPFFNHCGGCDLMHISISNALDYKLDKVNEILHHNEIFFDVKEIIKSDNAYNYRNKVTLKIINDSVGYFSESSHELVVIDYCYLLKESINAVIKDIKLLNIHNGEITIRANYKDEILLIINTEDSVLNIEEIINKHKIVGIICNGETIYGENYFIDCVNDYLFKVSYNSFFQVNPYITSKLFDLIFEYTKNSQKLLDLYCGVGTLSIASSSSYTLGVEIVENAIVDANLNKIFNKKDNIDFICADTNAILEKITNEYDTIILDPPRSGVSKKVISKILEVKPQTIIYVSCNPLTLARDLKLLNESYNINDIKLLEMFANTEHVECFSLLSLRKY